MSQIKTFLIGAVPDADEEAELNGFLKSHRIVDIQRVFDARGWHFCVEWIDGGTDAGRSLRFPERIDYMKELDPKTFSVFSRLRVLRKELAKEAGVPPFGVATDAQLAAMAKLETPSTAGIAKIEGFGEARVKAYGDKFLAALLSGDKPDESVNCGTKTSSPSPGP